MVGLERAAGLGRPLAVLGVLDEVQVGVHAGVVLQVFGQEGGGEMLRDVVHAGVVPHRVGVVVGRDEFERGHRQPGLLGRRHRRTGIVVGVLKRQQETRRIDGALEDVSHAR